MIISVFTVLNNTIQIRETQTRLTTGFFLFQWIVFLWVGMIIFGIFIIGIGLYRWHLSSNQKIHFLSFVGSTLT